MVECFLIVVPIYIAAIRIQLNAHHPIDVIFGLILGTIIASLVHYIFIKKSDVDSKVKNSQLNLINYKTFSN